MNCKNCNIELNDENWRPSCKSKNILVCKFCKSKAHQEYLNRYPEMKQGLYQKYRATNLRVAKEKDQRNRLSWREQILNHYGRVCSCCGETNWEFLAIDHVNGGGNQHRKELGGSKAVLKFIVTNNFPDDYRILCHNCNQSMGTYGYCPHQKKDTN